MEVEYSFHNGMVRKEQIEDTICWIRSSSSDDVPYVFEANNLVEELVGGRVKTFPIVYQFTLSCDLHISFRLPFHLQRAGIIFSFGILRRSVVDDGQT